MSRQIVRHTIARIDDEVMVGSVRAGTIALATDAGQSGIAGLVHARLGVGSMIAGLSVAALPTRLCYPARVLVAALGLLFLSLPLLDTHTLGRLFVVALVLGPAVAPYVISVFMLGERAAPPSRVGAASTLLAGASGVGHAIGSALASHLADEHAHPGAFAVAVTAAGLPRCSQLQPDLCHDASTRATPRSRRPQLHLGNEGQIPLLCPMTSDRRNNRGWTAVDPVVMLTCDKLVSLCAAKPLVAARVPSDMCELPSDLDLGDRRCHH